MNVSGQSRNALPFVGIHDFCYFGRFQDKSGHDLLRRKCPLLTQSGHAEEFQLAFSPTGYNPTIYEEILPPCPLVAATEEYKFGGCNARKCNPI